MPTPDACQARSVAFSAGAMALLLALAGTLGVLVGSPATGVAVLVVAVLFLVRLGVAVSGTWASLLVIFLVFHGVYGFSGPIAALTGAPLPTVFSPPFQVTPFLVQFGLATAGLALGLLFVARRVAGPAAPRLAAPGTPMAGIAVTAIGSLMELINCVRAGGLPVVVQGKAIYQSAVDELALTLPSSQVVSVGLAVTVLAWVTTHPARPVLRRQALLLLLAMVPVLAITMALGYRTPMLEWFLVLALGLRYTQPVARLNMRLVGWAVALYIVSGLIFANRAVVGIGLATGDWEGTWARITEPERLSVALNPAATEFGAAFGNFSEFEARSNDRLRLGETYVRALALPIPGFLYPGQKPQQAAYEFRDQFFPDLASQGAIAGTAYSSILEAYANFGVLGNLGVYLVLGLLLGAVERLRLRARRQAVHLAYLLMVPSGVAFHRSDFSTILGAAFLVAIVVTLYEAGRMLLEWAALPFVPGPRRDRPPALPAPHRTSSPA